MSYLLDTNVLSELRKKTADPQVAAWAQARPRQSLFLSVLALGEVRKGIERANAAAFRQALADWLDVDLPNWFVGRILPIDDAVVDQWGRIQASVGRTLPSVDGLLAATALHHHLTLVTRNVADFAGVNVPLVNPWDI